MPGADGRESPAGRVVGLAVDGTHRFSKHPTSRLRLLEGLGVEGDAHSGTTVQHLSRVRRDPSQPNLRQVHLIHVELFKELESLGFHVKHGELGENVATSGIDLLALPRGSRLRLGHEVVVEITGLRNPCAQIDRFRPGLMAAVLGRDADGSLVRKAGVMAVVRRGGEIALRDPIAVDLPPEPHARLEPV